MKLLIACNTIDLKYGMIAPTFWQLFKALYEAGNEVIVTPYLGRSVESLWWRSYENPCLRESTLYNSLMDRRQLKSVGSGGAFSSVSMAVIKNYIRPRWERHLLNILYQEGDVDVVLFMNVPFNHFAGIPSNIKKRGRMPCIAYDGDLPTSLPMYAEARAFKFDYYPGADLAEYDAFLSSSKGAIPLLEEMGAENVHAFYYGVDPTLYSPIPAEPDIDVFYYGRNYRTKEARLNFMIAKPSRLLPQCRFLVGGQPPPDLDIGLAKTCGVLPISAWRSYAGRSKININITKAIDAEVYATSSMRPFELASMGCCVVSDPYLGLEEWFKIGKEMFVAHDDKEAIETYKTLLASEELRIKTGELARKRVLKQHTVHHRARQLIDIVQGTQQEDKKRPN